MEKQDFISGFFVVEHLREAVGYNNSEKYRYLI